MMNLLEKIQIQNKVKELISEFFKISLEEVENKIRENPDRALEQWNNSKSIDDFYKTSDVYIYGLTDFCDSERLLNILFPIRNIAKDLTILDYGAGIGLVSGLFSNDNKVYYYDVSSLTQDFAKFLSNKLNFDMIFLNSEDVFKRSYDLIILLDVLEHLENPIEIVKKLTNCLRRDGFLLTSGMIFSTGSKIPMHLVNNKNYIKEYDEFVKDNFYMYYFMRTDKEAIFLLRRK